MYYAYITEKEREIVESWDECSKKTKGVSGARFKKFKDKNEALAFIGKAPEKSTKENKVQNEDTQYDNIFFVDGSFDEASTYYSYGLVYQRNQKIVHMESGKSNKHPESRQVGGEIMGVMKALNFAKKQGLKKVAIAYDYEGIRSHAKGYWKPKEETSKIYKKWFDAFVLENSDMDIEFVKVKAHSGDICNEYADELAKRELNMSGPYQNKMLEELKRLKTKN